jgi:hypothetical protein
VFGRLLKKLQTDNSLIPSILRREKQVCKEQARPNKIQAGVTLECLLVLSSAEHPAAVCSFLSCYASARHLPRKTVKNKIKGHNLGKERNDRVREVCTVVVAGPRFTSDRPLYTS